MPTLYEHPFALYCQKVLIALDELGLAGAQAGGGRRDRTGPALPVPVAVAGRLRSPSPLTGRGVTAAR